MYLFEQARANGFEYAGTVIESIQQSKNQFVAMSGLRLFGQIADLFTDKNKLPPRRRGIMLTDKKELEKINEKKLAQGQRISM